MSQVVNSVGIELVPVTAITSRVSIRSVKRSGVERLKQSMRKFGFLPQHALLVTRKADGTYELEDGNHRLEAATELGIAKVPVHILEGELSDNDKKRIARESNEAAGTLILTTLVDDAEFVWGEVKLGKKLAEIAEILGWSESKVKQYSALAAINKGAWEIITATLERNERLLNEESDEKVTIVTFSEGLLRCILNLTAEQQIELVRSLVSGEINKGQFKTLATNHRASNDMKTYIAENPKDFLAVAYEGLSPYVIKQLEKQNVRPEHIADIAKWARDFKSDIKWCASMALLIGSWMLGCTEGDTPCIGDPPYTQEHLEREGRLLWALTPSDIPRFLEFGRLERSLHELEVSKGRDYFEVSDEDMLFHVSQDKIYELAREFINIMFLTLQSISHYVLLMTPKEEKTTPVSV